MAIVEAVLSMAHENIDHEETNLLEGDAGGIPVFNNAGIAVAWCGSILNANPNYRKVYRSSAFGYDCCPSAQGLTRLQTEPHQRRGRPRFNCRRAPRQNAHDSLCWRVGSR